MRRAMSQFAGEVGQDERPPVAPLESDGCTQPTAMTHQQDAHDAGSFADQGESEPGIRIQGRSGALNPASSGRRRGVMGTRGPHREGLRRRQRLPPPSATAGARLFVHHCGMHMGVVGSTAGTHHGYVSQPHPERQDDYEAWRDLQVVLEERDREWWAAIDEDAGAEGSAARGARRWSRMTGRSGVVPLLLVAALAVASLTQAWHASGEAARQGRRTTRRPQKSGRRCMHLSGDGPDLPASSMEPLGSATLWTP